MRNYNKIVIIMCMFFLILAVKSAEKGGEEDKCPETSCNDNGPIVRFPFWLKGSQPSYCGYPGFDLSCTEKNQTVLELPISVKLYVKEIDYKSQTIYAYDPNTCIQRHLINLNISISSFHFKQNYLSDYTFFNCTSRTIDLGANGNIIPCVGSSGYELYVIHSDTYMGYMPFSSCTKMYDIFSYPKDILTKHDGLLLTWSRPACSTCGAEGKKCRLKSNSPSKEIECFGSLNYETIKGGKKKAVIVGSILGSLLFVLVVLVISYVHLENKADKENQVKIEKFLADYKAFKPTRYSYADIKRITSNFRDKLGQGGYGTVFKGRLCHEIMVAVKILNNTKGNGEEFINEVGTMSQIHHVNVVRLVGYCADGFARALVYEFLPNESLEKFIFSTDRNGQVLGWEKLLNIALGVAKGIEYLHQGCEQRILHFDIKPHNILLDDNFNPKITDFGLAKLCSKDQSAISMTTARGTVGYIAPEVFSRNFGNVSYKSDVYSFGMLVLEMFGGRDKIDVKVENVGQVYFPEWIYNNLEQGEELRICIEDEEDNKIAKKLAIVGLWCIQWYPANRPSICTVIEMLEGDENLKVPPNPFSSIRSNVTQKIIHGKQKLKQELSVIPETE